jgi:hypothetical protein
MGHLTLLIRLAARFSTTVLLVLLAACSSQPHSASLPPVGPAPLEDASPGSTGYLVVYSAWSNFVDQGSTGHHSRYTITSDDGAFTREVINHVDRFDEGPIRLPLLPGRYHVRARSAHFGRVNVPVVIQKAQITFVYLDGATHPRGPSVKESDTVRLPDGEVVGWSITVANNGSSR